MSNTESKLLISTGSEKQMVKEISKFYFSTNIKLVKLNDTEFAVHNANGLIQNVKVLIKLKRYRFVRTI